MNEDQSKSQTPATKDEPFSSHPFCRLKPAENLHFCFCRRDVANCPYAIPFGYGFICIGSLRIASAVPSDQQPGTMCHLPIQEPYPAGK